MSWAELNEQEMMEHDPRGYPWVLFSDEYGYKGAIHAVCVVDDTYAGMRKAGSLQLQWWFLYQPESGDVVYIPRGEATPTQVQADGAWTAKARTAIPAKYWERCMHGYSLSKPRKPQQQQRAPSRLRRANNSFAVLEED